MEKFKVNDIVKCPHKQEGIIIKIKDIPWEHKYVVKITKPTLSNFDDIEDYRAQDLELTDKELLIQEISSKLGSMPKVLCGNLKCELHEKQQAGSCSRKICRFADIIYTHEKKYLTINNCGHLIVFRNEEYWREHDLVGDKYVLSLVQRIAELEEKI